MDFTWAIKYATEFLGTAILIILGNGAVANVELKGTKGHQSGWLVIAVGYGMGVMIPALMFGNVSGNHINPAFTLGLAVSGLFPWEQVPYYILAQVLGAIFGQAMVVATHRPYYLKTENSNNILGTFSTISSVDHGTKESRFAASVNGFINEFVGSFILFFAALGMTKNFFGAELVAKAQATINDQVAQAAAQGTTIPQEQVTAALDPEMVREVLDVILDLAAQGRTMIIVTHEMQFARAVADRIIFLEGGKIQEDETPDEFFEHPKTDRAKKFLNTFTFESVKRDI